MNEQQKPNIPWWQPGLALFWRLSGWIAGPVLVAVLVGKWLDGKFHTAPWLFLLCVGTSFVISTVALIYIGLKEMKEIEKENKK